MSKVPDININQVVWDSATLYYGKFDLTNIDTSKLESAIEVIRESNLIKSLLNLYQELS